MAKLTKAQQEELDELRRELALAKSFSFPGFSEPKKQKRPETYDKEVHGWQMNDYDKGWVKESWQSSVCTYDKPPKKDERDYRNGTRDMPVLYLTEADAYHALYLAMQRRFSEALANVLKKYHQAIARQSAVLSTTTTKDANP